MIDTLIHLSFILVANSLFIWGLNACFQEGMIFHRLHQYAIGWDKIEKVPNVKRERISEWLQKPLYSCPICMASIWGTIGFFAGLCILDMPLKMVIAWPVYCVCLAGLNAIIYNLYPCDNEQYF